MAADRSKKSNPFDPQALLEAQRRNFAAFTNAGQIVADGMRTYAERQIGMVQEAMRNLWSELQSSTQKPQAATAPAEQLDRMRAAFERVMAQVQELGNLLLKVQSEAMAVLNECAAKNLEAIGASAPELAELQRRAQEAFEAAARQTTAVIEEMRRRMASLEQETRKAAAEQPPAATPTTTAAATAPTAAAEATMAGKPEPAARQTPEAKPGARKPSSASARTETAKAESATTRGRRGGAAKKES
ncbi:phasin family protein [Benzoatithermus flavus]|uniref:Phasin family protein n=1 Tax=Benzoatithermus flavus TaxID=3108223 RepID=A0ABU8XXM9_9PROT